MFSPSFGRSQYVRISVWISLVALALAGCGGSGNLGRVSGKVTLDGQPVPEATLMFSPVAGGSPSAGRTDESGQYELVYSRESKGAEIGQHRVQIRTAQSGDEDADPPVPPKPEKLPPKYLGGATIAVEVKAGKNELDFPLDSSATIPPNLTPSAAATPGYARPPADGNTCGP